VKDALLAEDNVLDFSPFNFLQGINNRRLLKGHSSMSKAHLIQSLTCLFCNHIVVAGKECGTCELNICTPCFKKWQQSESAKHFQTPCKCPGAELKSLNKMKQELLSVVRFKCNNLKCLY
jgi:hypothetical protein